MSSYIDEEFILLELKKRKKNMMRDKRIEHDSVCVCVCVCIVPRSLTMLIEMKMCEYDHRSV